LENILKVIYLILNALFLVENVRILVKYINKEEVIQRKRMIILGMIVLFLGAILKMDITFLLMALILNVFLEFVKDFTK